MYFDRAVTCAQYMLYQKHVLESTELELELSICFEIVNQGAVDLANTWSAGRHTRHVNICQNFLRELKEAGILLVKVNRNPTIRPVGQNPNKKI